MNNTDFSFLNKCQDLKSGYVYYLENILYLLPVVITISCMFAVFANLFLGSILLRGFLTDRFVSKRLLLVVNRCICDLLTAFVAGVYLFGVKIDCDMIDCRSSSVIPDIFMEFMITLNYWILAATYIGTSLLTCYAVRMPLRYKLSLSMKKTALFIVISWVIFVFFLVLTYLLDKNTLFASNGLLYMIRNKYHGNLEYWMVDLCGSFINESTFHVSLISIIFPVANYLLTLSGYLFVVVTLFLKRKEQMIPSRHRSCARRLGIHFTIFTFSFLLMGTSYWATYPISNSCISWSQRLTEQESRSFQDDKLSSNCSTEHLQAFLNYGLATFLSGIGWFARMTVDTIVDLLTDKQLRELMVCGRRRRFQERVAAYALYERRNSSTRSHSTVN